MIYQGRKSPGFWLFWAKSQQSVLNWLSEHEYQFESVGHTNTVCSAVMRIESQTLAKPNSPKYRRVLLEVQRQVQIQTCLQTMLNLWWIVKQSIPQIVAVVLLKQNSGFEAVKARSLKHLMSWSTQTALKPALTGHKLCESQAHFMRATLKDMMLNALQRWLICKTF